MLVNNAVFGKTMENLEIESSYMSHKIFDNDLVVIREKKVTLTLNKPAYIGICIFKLSKVLKWEFHYDYVKINMVTTQDYYSQTVIAKCMKLKLEMSIKILAVIMK